MKWSAESGGAGCDYFFRLFSFIKMDTHDKKYHQIGISIIAILKIIGGVKSLSTKLSGNNMKL
ncbi:MAG: hypothetical protein DRO88_12220 [Promethearchaeia archaeon]|nr:MAG: hypothetical protein DRO88_12220 [Candidatus Lokiarchaeia archaeon]